MPLTVNNNAAEADASGIDISESMRAQIRSTGMARQNVENGLTMLHTTDLWLQITDNMLSRMHELSVEAGDGTKTTQNITNGSSSAAKFNGLSLFRNGDGRGNLTTDTVGVSIQIGADRGMTVKIELKQMDKSSTDVLTYSKATGSTGNVDGASVIDNTKISVRSTESIGKVSTAIDHIANSRPTPWAVSCPIKTICGRPRVKSVTLMSPRSLRLR